MKAQILYGIGNIKYAEVDPPKPKTGEALIKVTKCGICGSDIPRIYKTGAHNMPLIPGHEFTGTVEWCQDEHELVGKRVGIFPLIPCMKCAQCATRHYEMCENYNYLGSRCDGGYAEYVCAPLWNLLPIPDEVTDDEAAMLEPMCVAIHAMRNIGLLNDDYLQRSEVHKKPGKVDNFQPNIAVCGLGTIGLIIAMLIKYVGYSNVFFIGNKSIQKEMLLKMGFEEEKFCDVRYGDPAMYIKEKTQGKGVDYYFECIGRSESYAQAVNLTAPLGKVMLVGNPASDMELPRDIYWKILRNQLTLKGTWNSSYFGRNHGAESHQDKVDECHDDWAYALKFLSAWRKEKMALSPSMLITHRFNLEDMQEGLQIMHKKSEEYIKIMVETQAKKV